MGGFLYFEAKFSLIKKIFQIRFGVGKAEAFFALERNIDPVGILPLGGRVDVKLNIFTLPEVPNGDQTFAFGF